jgi:hypothetical protein
MQGQARDVLIRMENKEQDMGAQHLELSGRLEAKKRETSRMQVPSLHLEQLISVEHEAPNPQPYTLSRIWCSALRENLNGTADPKP